MKEKNSFIIVKRFVIIYYGLIVFTHGFTLHNWFPALQGYKLTVAQLMIKIYSTANGVSRTALISVFSFIKMSGRLEFVYLVFCQTGNELELCIVGIL